MIQYTPYMLTTLLSSVIILIMGICMLVIYVPREPELKNYRIARLFLFGAYVVLAAGGQMEFWNNASMPDDELVVMVFTLIDASFQSALFTFSIITLINVRYMTLRRIWSSLLLISFISSILFAGLFIVPDHFFVTFYIALLFYCLQLIYYVRLFMHEYSNYRQRFDNFFSDNESRRLIWTRNSFCMAACVGIFAIIALFVNREVYIVFTARLFHLSFDLGEQCPYPYRCDMGANSIVGNQ